MELDRYTAAASQPSVAPAPPVHSSLIVGVGRALPRSTFQRPPPWSACLLLLRLTVLLLCPPPPQVGGNARFATGQFLWEAAFLFKLCVVEPTLFASPTAQVGNARFATGHFLEAAFLFKLMVTSTELEDFLTLKAYDILVRVWLCVRVCLCVCVPL